MWVAKIFFSTSLFYVFQQTSTGLYIISFFTIVLIRFQSLSLAFKYLIVSYPTVTSEDVCWGMLRHVRCFAMFVTAVCILFLLEMSSLANKYLADGTLKSYSAFKHLIAWLSRNISDFTFGCKAFVDLHSHADVASCVPRQRVEANVTRKYPSREHFLIDCLAVPVTLKNLKAKHILT